MNHKFRLRLEIDCETDDDNMLCVRVYHLPEYTRVAIGNQYPDEKPSDTILRVMNEALSELDN